ncbi:DoxX family protein [Arthrobacter sp. I2-34]|uniref:DoxX family protein n=1 Tax=Arthrobacter hankyongi TaxID=2904801 RepID=A0ABS9LBU9_9MICC|nr:DoxX family protein [Arthrobacter hankyongi]MCG2624154.1 DoxX family protein [Arthrobacter hankyongi]
MSAPAGFSYTGNDAALRRTAVTVLRVGTGIIFVAYGWQKISTNIDPGVTGYFTYLSVPLSGLMAPLIAYLEFLGGIVLFLGLLTRPVALLFVCDMTGALLLVHLPAGLFVEVNGFSQVLILSAASLAIALKGPGPCSLDRIRWDRQQWKASVPAQVQPKPGLDSPRHPPTVTVGSTQP